MNSADVTAILRQFSSGDMEAARDLIPLVYQQLRRMAAYQLRRERRDHTLQPTLVGAA